MAAAAAAAAGVARAHAPSSGTRGRRPASQRVRAELGELCSARRFFIYRDDELLGVLTD
jgi:hypothetical protein